MKIWTFQNGSGDMRAYTTSSTVEKNVVEALALQSCERVVSCRDVDLIFLAKLKTHVRSLAKIENYVLNGILVKTAFDMILTIGIQVGQDHPKPRRQRQCKKTASVKGKGH